MPNIAKILKDEIQRLARREVKAATASLRQENATLKSSMADLKKRLAKLESLKKQVIVKAEARQPQPKAPEENGAVEIQTARITGKMIRTIRKRLGLSQDNFARLAGVSGQTIYQWERKAGRLSFRGDSKRIIVGIRSMTKDEAKLRLAEINAQG